VPSDLLIRDVLVLVPTGEQTPSRKDILIANGHIADIVEGGRAPTAGMQIVDGRDRLLLPGLVNAHTHSPLNVLKGTGDALSHPAFMWRNQADTAGRTPNEVRLSALLGCIEHLLNGTTAVIDHFPEQGFDDASVDALVDAYQTSGMRALIALRIYDEDYADIEPPDGFPPDFAIANPLTPPPLDESLALVESAIRRHNGAAEGRYGVTMIQHLDRIGLLNDRLSTAHTIWLDDDDIALMAARGAIPVHNPESNLKLGAGISPVAKMVRAGVTVALGTDGAGTNDNLDLHEVMRLALLLQRPGEPDRKRWPTAHDALAMATIAGGKAMRRPGLGTLALGAPADFVLHDLNTPFWTPLNDPLLQLVFGASGSTVDTVIIGGRVVVEQRRIMAFDVAPILAEARGMVERLRDRNAGLQAWAGKIEEAVL
jgi:5-methylthioadenosine/S-adenosylhomocysteine deaminase